MPRLVYYHCSGVLFFLPSFSYIFIHNMYQEVEREKKILCLGLMFASFRNICTYHHFTVLITMYQKRYSGIVLLSCHTGLSWWSPFLFFFTSMWTDSLALGSLFDIIITRNLVIKYNIQIYIRCIMLRRRNKHLYSGRFSQFFFLLSNIETNKNFSISFLRDKNAKM